MARSGLFKAILDAIFGSDDNIAGQAVTELTTQLTDTEPLTINVKSTLRFGENRDGATDALLLVNGEVIYAQGRTLTSFTTLMRGVDTTEAKTSPPGTLVYDISSNRTALDLVRRGLWVRTARLEDLDVIGRNLGLHKCPGLDEETWRSLIQVMAYLPDQPLDAFRRVLDVYPGVGNYRMYEEAILFPNEVFIEIVLPLATGDVRGRFYLNGGEPSVVQPDGVTIFTVYPINSVLGVRASNDLTLRGERDPAVAPDLYVLGSSFLGSTITLGAPVAPGTLVLVDYGAFTAHYLAADETAHYPSDGDFFPYLSDPSAIVSCLLDQVRAAGVRVHVTAVL